MKSPSILRRRLLIPAFLLVLQVFPAPLRLSASVGLEGRLTTGWEYDDNVLEDPAERTAGGAGTVSLFSSVRMDSPQSVSRLDYQIGYKGHHRLSSNDSVSAGNILVHRLRAETERLAGTSALGVSGELKLRNVYRKNPINLLSEEGYVRGQGQLYLRRSLRSVGALTLGARVSFFDFETFDTFNFSAIGPRARLARRLGENLTGAAEYSYTRRAYDRPVSLPGPEGELLPQGYSQRDNLQQLDLSLSYGRGWLMNFIYTIQHNGSNNYGFSYWNNRFSLLHGQRLPGELYLNAYLFFELRRYSDKTDHPIQTDIITEENENNGAVIKLSRPLAARIDASVTWSLYRNQSTLRDLDFRKNLLNFALTWRL